MQGTFAPKLQAAIDRLTQEGKSDIVFVHAYNLLNKYLYNSMGFWIKYPRGVSRETINQALAWAEHTLPEPPAELHVWKPGEAILMDSMEYVTEMARQTVEKGVPYLRDTVWGC